MILFNYAAWNREKICCDRTTEFLQKDSTNWHLLRLSAKNFEEKCDSVWDINRIFELCNCRKLTNLLNGHVKFCKVATVDNKKACEAFNVIFTEEKLIKISWRYAILSSINSAAFPVPCISKSLLVTKFYIADQFISKSNKNHQFCTERFWCHLVVFIDHKYKARIRCNLWVWWQITKDRLDREYDSDSALFQQTLGIPDLSENVNESWQKSNRMCKRDWRIRKNYKETN